jgi:hypothetical protein
MSTSLSEEDNRKVRERREALEKEVLARGVITAYTPTRRCMV